MVPLEEMERMAETVLMVGMERGVLKVMMVALAFKERWDLKERREREGVMEEMGREVLKVMMVVRVREENKDLKGNKELEEGMVEMARTESQDVQVLVVSRVREGREVSRV